MPTTKTSDKILTIAGASTGSTMGVVALDANNQNITNIPAPSSGTDAINKDYADTKTEKVNPSVTDNVVTFADTSGEQKDSGVPISSIGDVTAIGTLTLDKAVIGQGATSIATDNNVTITSSLMTISDKVFNLSQLSGDEDIANIELSNTFANANIFLYNDDPNNNITATQQGSICIVSQSNNLSKIYQYAGTGGTSTPWYEIQSIGINANLLRINSQEEYDSFLVGGGTSFNITENITIELSSSITTALGRFIVSPGVNFTLLGNKNSNIIYVYLGTGALSASVGADPGANFIRFSDIFGLAAPAGAIFNYENITEAISIENCAISPCNVLGNISTCGLFKMSNTILRDFNVGFSIINSKESSMDNLIISSENDIGMPYMDFFALDPMVIKLRDTACALGATETLIRLDAGLPLTSQALIENINFETETTTLFDTSGRFGDISDISSISFSGIAISSVTDSSGKARFNFSGETVYINQIVTLSGFSESTYNVTMRITDTDNTTYFESETLYVSNDSGAFASELIECTYTADGQVTSVTDNGGTARFNFTGVTMTVGQTIRQQGFNEADYNGTFTVVTTDNSTYWEGSVVFDGDDTGEIIATSIGVPMVAEEGITIDTNGGLDYDGGYPVLTIITMGPDRFVINQTATALTTGHWSTKGLDETDYRVKSINNFGNKDSKTTVSLTVNNNSAITTLGTPPYDFNFGDLLVNSANERFKLISSTTGEFLAMDKFIGAIFFNISVSTTGGSKLITYQFYKSTDNGVTFKRLPTITAATVEVKTELVSVPLIAPISLERGDRVKPQIVAANGDFTVLNAQIYSV